MPQKLINVGSVASDATYDSLRTIAIKVNENFGKTYIGGTVAAGRIESETTISGNVITENLDGVVVTTTIGDGVIVAFHGAPVNETWQTTIGSNGSISTVRIA